jgi:tetratricopeptide (TPR) repeat protein
MQRVARGVELGVGVSMTLGGIGVAGYEMGQTGLTYESGANFASNVVDALVGGAHGGMRLRHTLKYRGSTLGSEVGQGFSRLRQKGVEGLDTLRVKLRELHLDETGAVGPGVAELSTRNVTNKALQQLDRVGDEVQQRLQKGDTKGALKIYDDAMLTARAAYNRTKDPQFQDEFQMLKRERDELAGGAGPAEKKGPELRSVKPEPEHARIPEEEPVLGIGLRDKERETVNAHASKAMELATEGKYKEALKAYNTAISLAESAYRGTKKDEFVAKRDTLVHERDVLVGMMKARGIPTSEVVDLKVRETAREKPRGEAVIIPKERHTREMPKLKEPGEQAETYFKSTVDDARRHLKEGNLTDALLKYDEAIDFAESAGKGELKRTLETEREGLLVDMRDKGIAPDQAFGAPRPKEEVKKPVPETSGLETTERKERPAKMEKPETQAEKLRRMTEAAERRKKEAALDVIGDITGDQVIVPPAQNVQKPVEPVSRQKGSEAEKVATAEKIYQDLITGLGIEDAETLVRAVISPPDKMSTAISGISNRNLTPEELRQFAEMDPKKRAERAG